MAAASPSGAPPPSLLPSCTRCKSRPQTLELRGAGRVCATCHNAYITNKFVKRLEVIQRDINAESQSASKSISQSASNGDNPGREKPRGRPPRPRPLRSAVALSRGPCSVTMLHMLAENLKIQRERGWMRFEILACWVDTDLAGTISEVPRSNDEISRTHTIDGLGASDTNSKDIGDLDPLAPYGALESSMKTHRVPLTDCLTLSTISWDLLPPLDQNLAPAARLMELFARLPSTSSVADVTRLLIRHLLLNFAARQGCDILLLGSSTTTLAELTLAETAKGRGVGVPIWASDGVCGVPDQLGSAQRACNDGNGLHESRAQELRPPSLKIPTYHPLREISRSELLIYASTTEPALSAILPDLATVTETQKPVVSHKYHTIDDVISRFFVDVERGYPAVVANVVRTTGKLNRDIDEASGGAGERCGLCSTALDNAGDERWRGELGEELREIPVSDESIAQREKQGRLCYGCNHSVND